MKDIDTKSSGWALIPFLVASAVSVAMSARRSNLEACIDSFSLISCLYYQSLLALVVVFAIVFNTKKGNRK